MDCGVEGVLLGERYGLVAVAGSLGAEGLDSESDSESASQSTISSSAVDAPVICQHIFLP